MGRGEREGGEIGERKGREIGLAIPPISSTDYHPMSCWILSCLSPSPNDEKIPQPPPSCWLPVRLQLRPHCMAARGGGGDVHTCAPPLLTSSARTRGYMIWAYKPPPSECGHHLGILTVSKGAMCCNQHIRVSCVSQTTFIVSSDRPAWWQKRCA